MSDDEVPWLDEGEMRAWLSLISLIHRLPDALDAQLRRDADMSHFEYQVLAALSTTEQHTMAMSDVARFTEGSLSRLSHTVKRLESKGFVRRMPCPTDGRVTLATLTDAGHDKIVVSAPGHARAVREYVFDPLTKAQVRHLTEITERIARATGQDPG